MAIQPLLQNLLPPFLAVLGALLVDRMSERRGLLPVGFRLRRGDSPRQIMVAVANRVSALVVLTVVFWVGVFGPLADWGSQEVRDLSQVPTWQLFLLHLMLALGVLLWLGLGGRSDPRDEGPMVPPVRNRLGLATRHPGREVGIGLAAGVAAWVMVIVAVLGLAVLIQLLGAEDLLPQTPPAVISWIVGLPMAVRLALSLSAGVVEEVFFRGFLQPRIGLALSSLLFVVAHMSYGQPLMLLGVALLSVYFGLLVVWRRNLWAAMAAHFAFDAIQLLIAIPAMLEFLPDDSVGGGLAALLAACAGVAATIC